MSEIKYTSLSELNKKVREVLREHFSETTWLIAEISELRVNRNGHCYIELIEKGEGSQNIIAKANAVVWSHTWRMLQPYFETTTQKSLAPGMKILIKGSAEFHELYGYSISIKDIDPTYTIGEIARLKAEIILKLKEQGIFEMNKELTLPLLFKNIAVISSETAAGYGDFLNQLIDNSFDYHFNFKLFPAVMQGDATAASIISALERIYKYERLFDCVVIIRGGGAQSDLNAFNNYDLACNITQFPLPVFTGIGHERDETIADMVAHTRLKTPTAVAEFLINHNTAFEDRLLQYRDHLFELVSEYVSEHNILMESLVHRFDDTVNNYINDENITIQKYLSSSVYRVKLILANKKRMHERISDRLVNSFQQRFQKSHHKFDLHENTIQHIDPSNILKRGFSYTMKNGKAINNISAIAIGDVITTVMNDGRIESKVNNVELNK